jgi:hypothetical protein
VSYFPSDPNEKPGCLDTLVIIRIVLGILLVPMLLLFGAVGIAALAFYAYSAHPLLTFVPVVAGLGVILLVANWEKSRYEREQPPDR